MRKDPLEVSNFIDYSWFWGYVTKRGEVDMRIAVFITLVDPNHGEGLVNSRIKMETF